MAENHRAVAQHIVDMDVAIDVMEPGALAAREKQRHRRAGIAHVAAHPSGQVPAGPVIELDRLGETAHAPIQQKQCRPHGTSSILARTHPMLVSREWRTLWPLSAINESPGSTEISCRRTRS